MAKQLVWDELWRVVATLLPPPPTYPKGGRPRVADRAALTGILFVRRSGIPWELLPAAMGCGSGMRCWRRRDWHEAGVWQRLHQALLDRLGAAGQLDWSRANLDAQSIPAAKGGHTGPNPTDRGKAGTKRPLPVDRRGTPLAVPLSAANVHDSTVFGELLDAVAPARPPRGRPRKRPAKPHAGKGYDYRKCRRALRQRGIKARIARRGVESGQRLGPHRWVVERTFAWLNRFRRLRVRYGRRDDLHLAFTKLACALITCRAVTRFC